MYISDVANTLSAKKALRGSEKKKQHNLFWKRRVRAVSKNIDKLLKEGKATDQVLNENLIVLQKMLDKASKQNVIHKNKANRLKSRYTKRISAHGSTKKKTTKAKGTKAKTK